MKKTLLPETWFILFFRHWLTMKCVNSRVFFGCFLTATTASYLWIDDFTEDVAKIVVHNSTIKILVMFQRKWNTWFLRTKCWRKQFGQSFLYFCRSWQTKFHFTNTLVTFSIQFTRNIHFSPIKFDVRVGIICNAFINVSWKECNYGRSLSVFSVSYVFSLYLWRIQIKIPKLWKLRRFLQFYDS